MADPGAIFMAADRFRRELLAHEAGAMRDMARAYGAAWVRIRAELEDVLAIIEAEMEAGREPTPALVLERGRLAKLQGQVEEQMTQFIGVAEGQIAGAQQTAVQLAAHHAESTVKRAGLGVAFDRLPDRALTDLVGFLGNGSPLRSLLDELGPEASKLARDTLIEGLALGRNPREMARDMRRAFGGNLVRALRVSRTEILRSYRESTSRHYAANRDVVQGWIWTSALQPGRTCLSCWAMHGTFHALEEKLDDHPSGRCTMVPAVRGVDMGIRSGVDLFAELPPEQQLAAMGPAKFEAWKNGEVGLADFVGRRSSGAWGTTRFEASLKEARARAGGQRKRHTDSES